MIDIPRANESTTRHKMMSDCRPQWAEIMPPSGGHSNAPASLTLNIYIDISHVLHVLAGQTESDLQR